MAPPVPSPPPPFNLSSTSVSSSYASSPPSLLFHLNSILPLFFPQILPMNYSPPILSLLTDDLLTKILNNLPDSSDHKSFRAVCKSFNRIESGHRTQIKVIRPEFLNILLRKYPHIKTLDLSVCPRIDDATVAMLLNGWVGHLNWNRNLRVLVLSRSTGLKHTGLEMLVGSCPGLVAVDVSYCCGFGDREAAALSCAAELREVRMDKCLGVTDVGLAKIAIGCEKMEVVSVKWCMEITDMGIDLLSKKCPHLKHLDISYLKVSNESLGSIGGLKKLEVLLMVNCGFVDDVGLHILGNDCPMLQVLDVSRCQNVTSSGLFSVIRGCKGLRQLNAGYCFLDLSTNILACLKDLKNLKTIRIDGSQVSDHVLHMINDSCTFLVEIGLGKCKGVTDKGIMLLVSGCLDLKILDLTCCDAITDVAISAIADSCKNLMSLKLESCSLLTGRSLKCLGSCCLLLEELDLTDCSGVNDQGLKHLSQCSELQSLKLGLCSNISDKGLSYMALTCKNIRELDLYRCIDIGDDGFTALGAGCRRIKKLNLSYCVKITDKGMEGLGQLGELVDLELRSLPDITDVGLAALASGCKKLAELDMKNCDRIGDSGFWSLAYNSKNLQQINLSHCAITDVGLCMLMGNLTCLQDVKLVNLTNVSVKGFELALMACCGRVKKVKVHNSLRYLLSPELLNTLQARGCRFRWD